MTGVVIADGTMTITDPCEDASFNPSRDATEDALLRRLGLVDAAPEAMFDRLTELVREVLNAPIALMSIVQPYADRQFFKSQCGLSGPMLQARHTPLSHSFCRHVRASGKLLVVCDSHVDPRVTDNPSVYELGVRAYLGCPIHLPDGQPIGALCAIDVEPRDWSDSQVAMLEWLATHVSQTISMISLTDAVATTLRSDTRPGVAAPGVAPVAAQSLDTSGRMTLAAEIWQGIERNEFVPHFQVQVDAHSNQLAGAEVLARWKRSNGDVLSPAEFLPMAIRLGVLDRIERQVMVQALFDADAWIERGVHIPELSFNMTYESIADPDVVATLQEHRPPGIAVAFEILESVMIENEESALDFHVDRIREAGFSIGLDDFGSGHASALALLRINADFIKIDRNLVSQMTRSRRHYAAIRAIIAMARECGARVTAEGVETTHQAQLLRGLGCDVFQGYLFSRPVDAADLGQVLSSLPGRHGAGRVSPILLPQTGPGAPNCRKIH